MEARRRTRKADRWSRAFAHALPRTTAPSEGVTTARHPRHDGDARGRGRRSGSLPAIASAAAGGGDRRPRCRADRTSAEPVANHGCPGRRTSICAGARQGARARDQGPVGSSKPCHHQCLPCPPGRPSRGPAWRWTRSLRTHRLHCLGAWRGAASPHGRVPTHAARGLPACQRGHSGRLAEGHRQRPAPTSLGTRRETTAW